MKIRGVNSDLFGGGCDGEGEVTKEFRIFKRGF